MTNSPSAVHFPSGPKLWPEPQGVSTHRVAETNLLEPSPLPPRVCMSGEAGDRSLSQVSNPNTLMWNVGYLTHRNWHPNPGVNVDSLICFKMILSGYLEGKYLF